MGTTNGVGSTVALERELKIWEAHKDALLGGALNKFVLIYLDDLVGTYDTEQDAVNDGYRRFGNVPFLVKHVTPVERPLNFLSGLVGL